MAIQFLTHRLAVGFLCFTLALVSVHCKSGNGTLEVAKISDEAYVNLFYPTPASINKSRLLLPTNLEYRGAFKLPSEQNGTSTFAYVAGAMTYYPKGDSVGASDGHPGSLFAAGHISQMDVAEISIPKPVISASKKLSELPTAKFLKPFRVLGGRPSNGANPVMGLTYLPAQGDQKTDKLYISQGDGYLPSNDHKSFWISDVDFTNQIGPFRVGTDAIHCYSDYIFPVPKSWSDQYTPGKRLLTGRHREGDLCGRGPALFSIAPWADGVPPALDKPITADPVLRYKQDVGLTNYSRGGDIYMDGAFLESAGKSSIIMVGQKGLSDGKYGNYCTYQGFHDLAGYHTYLIFYDPEEIGKSAKGEIAIDKAMPYSGIDLNQFLINPNLAECDKNNITAASYDPQNNFLYLMERNKENPVVHVFFINGGIVGIKRGAATPNLEPAISVASQGFRSSIQIKLPEALRALGSVVVKVLDIQGRNIRVSDQSHNPALRTFVGMEEGLYFVQVNAGERQFSERVFLTH